MSTCRTCSHWSDWPHDDIQPDQYGICFNVDGMPPDDAQPAVYIEADFGCRLMTLQSFACSSWKAAERSPEMSRAQDPASGGNFPSLLPIASADRPARRAYDA